MRELEELTATLVQAPTLLDVLHRTRMLELPDWYMGSGAIMQTVWNHKHGFDLSYGINDYDIVYFDPDLSYEAEDVHIQAGKKLFGELPVEIRNQARIHLWYPDHFGMSVQPVSSTEESISRWMCPCTTVGIRLEVDDTFTVFAAEGLYDVMNMIVRPHRTATTQHTYEKKVARWKSLWPLLSVENW